MSGAMTVAADSAVTLPGLNFFIRRPQVTFVPVVRLFVQHQPGSLSFTSMHQDPQLEALNHSR